MNIRVILHEVERNGTKINWYLTQAHSRNTENRAETLAVIEAANNQDAKTGFNMIRPSILKSKTKAESKIGRTGGEIRQQAGQRPNSC